MLKELIEMGYKKTIGALWNVVVRSGMSVGSRWNVVQLLYVIAVVGLMAGFVNAVVLPLPNQGQPIYPGAGSQTIPETFIDGMVILLGVGGIYTAYLSGRQTTRSRMVNLYLGFSLLLISVSVMMGIYLVSLKG